MSTVEPHMYELQLSHYRQIFDNSIDVIYMVEVTPHGDFIYVDVNAAYTKVTGTPREEVIGLNVDQIKDDTFRSILIEKFTLCLNAGDKTDYINEYPFPSGIMTFHSTLSPIRDESGRIHRIVGVARDISKQKNVETLLRQMIEFNEDIINTIPDLLFELDEKGTYLNVWAQNESLLAAQKRVLIGNNIRDILPHDAIEVTFKTMREVDMFGHSLGNTIYIDLPEGRKWFELSASKKKSSGTYIALSRDITERKRAEDSFRSQSVLLQAVLESSPDVTIFTLDREYNYIAFNQNHCNVIYHIWGHKIAIGMNMLDSITREDDKQKAKKLFDKALSGEHFVDETEYGDENLSRSYWQTYYAPIIDDNGEIIGFTCFNLNITDKREQEQLLAAKEREFRSLADSSPGMMGSFYLRPDGSTCMPYVSPNIIDLFGLAPEDVADDNSALFKLHHPDDNDRILETIAQSARTMSVWHQEFRIIHPSKGERWMESNTMPQPHPQGGIIWYGYIHDITERKKMESEIAKQKDFQNTLLLSIAEAGLGIHVIENGYYIYTNDIEKAKKYGYDETIMDVKPNFLDTIHPDDRGRALDMYTRRLAGEDVPSTYELGVVQTDGEKIEHSVSVIVIPNTDPLQTIVVTQDISARKKMEKLILQNESRLKEAQKIAKIGSWELQFPSLELSWSDEIYRIFEIIPNNEAPNYTEFISVIHPDDRDLVDLAYQQSLNNQTPYEVTHRLRMKDGRIKYVHEKGKTYYDTQGNPLRSIGTAQDVTEQKMVENKIEYMAHHDALTELPNRILAKDRTQQIIAYAKRTETKAAVLFIDLDGFKTINDSLGHAVGDTILKHVASCLMACIRKSDTISRLGGDEFLFILSDIKVLHDIIIIAEKLLKKLNKPFYIHNHTLSLSASIGIAVYPEHGETFDLLLKSADAAMYKAKESGKNTYCFYTQQMNHNLIGLFKMQNDLRSALENNEFILHYQPQIDLAKNQITGAEALIRWAHPELGMIPPMNFIPIAESSGLIVQIGQWVIEEACRQAIRWHKQGIEITVAVNISAVQFKRGNLEAVVKEALDASGLNPQLLELELTESILIHDAENILITVQNLKALGVQLSIDDFGTGYSSLAYLKRFAVDKLKIDQSFVRDILKDQEDATIVRTIIQMAKSLNLQTIAEGVENAEVLHIVQGYGCDEVQGYHFAKPMEAADLKKYHDDFPKGDLCQS